MMFFLVRFAGADSPPLSFPFLGPLCLVSPTPQVFDALAAANYFFFRLVMLVFTLLHPLSLLSADATSSRQR
jgi:hypothetical protein